MKLYKVHSLKYGAPDQVTHSLRYGFTGKPPPKIKELPKVVYVYTDEISMIPDIISQGVGWTVTKFKVDKLDAPLFILQTETST